jgi:hypothetical protein
VSEPARYIKPHAFDWGLYKAHGEFILLGTGALYLIIFAACVLLVRRAAVRLGYPRALLVAGTVALWPMVSACSDSLALQMTSAHYQEDTHLRALRAVAVTLCAAVLFSAVVEAVQRGKGTAGPGAGV